MKFNFKTVSLLVAVILLTSFNQAEANKEYTKVIHKEFSIDPEGEVSLENRRGTVEVVSWDQPSVEIEVTITVEARNEDDANEVFDKIDINFSDNGQSVSATTEVETSNKKRSWWNWSWHGKNKIDYSVDYKVKMPKTCDLDLEHSYGHATVTDLLADAVIELKYGDLKMGKIGGDLDLELGYGEAKVNEASKVDAEIWYSEFTITSLDKLDIESRYSDISVDYADEVDSESQYDHYSIGQAEDFKSNGRYDDIEIERVNNLNVESHYSDYILGHLSQSADLQMEYGDAKIKRLVDGFNRVKLKGNHVDFKIFPDEDASYMLNIESVYTHVEYPKQILRSNIDREGAKLEFDGIIGRDGDTQSEIRADTYYGQLIID